MNYKIYMMFSLSYFLFSNPCFCMQQNPCKQELKTQEKVKNCISWRVKNEGNGLFKLASKDHTGNIDKCTNGEEKKNSYFSSLENKFLSTIQNINFNTDCIHYENPQNKWECWGTTSGDKACHNKLLTSRILFVIRDGMGKNENNTKIITFYPTIENKK